MNSHSCILSVTEASKYIRKKVTRTWFRLMVFVPMCKTRCPLSEQLLGVSESWALASSFGASSSSLKGKPTCILSVLCFGIFNLCFGPRATASFSSLSVFNPAVPFDDLPCPPTLLSSWLFCRIHLIQDPHWHHYQMDKLLDLLPVPFVQRLRVSPQSWFHYLLACDLGQVAPHSEPVLSSVKWEGCKLALCGW